MNPHNEPVQLVKIANFGDRAGAEYARGLLEGQGIAAEVIISDAGGWGNYLLIGSGGCWVTVKPEDVARASNVLQEYDAPVDPDELEAEAMSAEPPEDV